MTKITFELDGKQVEAKPGETIWQVAKRQGREIPHLCHSPAPDYRPDGNCRACMVEIEGERVLAASCKRTPSVGMKVKTESARAVSAQKMVMELLVADQPARETSHDPDSKFWHWAEKTGVTESRFPAAERWQADASHPAMRVNLDACIQCGLCVRACREVQVNDVIGMAYRNHEAKIVFDFDDPMGESTCVACGECVQACPTATLTEKSVIEIGQPEHSAVTTCAYCGVGCSFKAEMRGEELVRMVPWKDGKANRGHSCVKGRFAWGYATHRDRILNPMIRESIDQPWREVSWEEALTHTASEFRRIQAKYGRDSVGGITSSRCTNEETYLVQKLIRAGFGNNNVDTCARVCHSPTGYGLGQAFGTSAGTQDFDSVEHTDVVIVIGANPTDGHPVFGSRLKKRLRQGAKLIVIDPRRIDLVDGPHVKASYHLPLKPGTNVAVVTALAHVIVTEGLYDEAFIRERCDWSEFQDWAEFVAETQHSPEAIEPLTGVPANLLRGAARLFATGGNGAIYYGLGVTEHSQGSTTVMAIANLAMATGNIGRAGVGVNPLRGQNNVQGSCDMGSFPHELPGYRHVSDDATRDIFEKLWGVELSNEPGLRIPNMLDAAVDGTFKALYIQGEDILQSDPDTHHVAAGLAAMECVVVQDLFLNETANYAHVFLPGSTFLEKDGTFTNAERRINRVRKVMTPKNGYGDWEVTQELARAMGLTWNYTHPSEIMAEIAATTPSFANVTYEMLDEKGSVQWPCNETFPEGSPIMHVNGFVRGKGKFIRTEYVATDERTGPRFPLLLTTGRILSQYNVGAQTRRTENSAWHAEDRLEIHPHDADNRGIRDGDWIRLASRAGETSLRALITDRVAPGVVYTTFHHPDTQANVITTDFSDWATNCPEYKVTAVQVSPSNGPSEWQEDYAEQARRSRRIVGKVEAAE